MDAVFTAASISGTGGLAASVSTLVVSFIGIALIFVGRRYAAKAGIR